MAHLIQPVREVVDERLYLIDSPLLQLQGVHRGDETLRLETQHTRDMKGGGTGRRTFWECCKRKKSIVC